MFEIKIKMHPRFVKDWAKSEVDNVIPVAVKRVAAICCSIPKPTKQLDGYEYSLDMSNDWKASREDEFIVVAYRYGFSETNAARMKALKEFLEWPHVLGDYQ